MLVIYDSIGNIYLQGDGFPEPQGEIKFLNNIEIPEGKIFAGINTDVEPNEPIFEDIPKSEMEILRERIDQLEANDAAILEGAKSVTGVE